MIQNTPLKLELNKILYISVNNLDQSYIDPQVRHFVMMVCGIAILHNNCFRKRFALAMRIIIHIRHLKKIELSHYKLPFTFLKSYKMMY